MKKKIIYEIIAFLFFIALVFGVPIIINECYLKNDGYLTVWDGTDVFAYYASVLSFMGTVTLGIVTVWQNKKSIDINDKLLNLETKSKIGYFIPQHRIKNNNTGVPIIYTHDFERKGITVLGTGNDIINVNKAVVNVNGRVFEDNYRIFVTTADEFRELNIPVELTDDERQLDEIPITLKIYMENSKKYQYIQILELNFKKEPNNHYSLTAFNSNITDDNSQKGA
ncbi:MAG: hypothetical protein HFE49_05845 [Clostridia bacterium]|nr:hypothetical protein [Clostridia bacterium]